MLKIKEYLTGIFDSPIPFLHLKISALSTLLFVK